MLGHYVIIIIVVLALSFYAVSHTSKYSRDFFFFFFLRYVNRNGRGHAHYVKGKQNPAALLTRGSVCFTCLIMHIKSAHEL